MRLDVLYAVAFMIILIGSFVAFAPYEEGMKMRWRLLIFIFSLFSLFWVPWLCKVVELNLEHSYPALKVEKP